MIKVNDHYIDTEMISVIEELKHQLELNGVKRFYKIKDTPRNLMVCCPFHKDGQERKPSMGIYKNDGTCHCFTCDWVGSISELVSNCFGYDDFGRFGIKWLLKNFMTLEVEERKDVDLDFSRHNSSANRIKYIGLQTNEVATRGFGNSCGDTKQQAGHYVEEDELDRYRYYHPYWGRRGITDERLIELFDLGYDKETNCITFPIRDANGNCLFVARRSVCTKFFNYPEGIEKPLYGLFELYQQSQFPREVIVCESMIDALTCWQYGKYAVALNGLGNNLQFAQLKQLPCRTLIIATDNDNAGIRARQRIEKNIHNKILMQYVFPKGKKDINDLSREEFLSLETNFL